MRVDFGPNGRHQERMDDEYRKIGTSTLPKETGHRSLDSANEDDEGFRVLRVRVIAQLATQGARGTAYKLVYNKLILDRLIAPWG